MLVFTTLVTVLLCSVWKLYYSLANVFGIVQLVCLNAPQRLVCACFDLTLNTINGAFKVT